MPCAALVAADAFTVSGPDLPVPPLVSFVVRFVTLGTILAFAVSFRWAHDQQAALLEYRATTDPLTGLANRHEFEHALAGALARATRFGRRGAVVFIDMDGMKSINDTLGHEVGDALLKEIAARIRSQTREVDTPARLGGDEFVVLMSEFDDAKGAEILGRKLSAVLAQPWTSEGRRIEPLASIGIAEFPELSGDPRELLRLADAAMYAAKRSEATRICAYRRSGIEEIA